MPDEFVLSVRIAPEGAIARLTAGINRPKKRLLGLLKTESEFIGYVRETEFEIWERQQRAVHAFGRVVGQHGGTRIEVAFRLPMRTRALIAVFFGLYSIVAIGIASRPPDTIVSIEELIVAVAGAALLALIFSAAARRQRADLRAFVEGVFTDVPRI